MPVKNPSESAVLLGDQVVRTPSEFDEESLRRVVTILTG